MPQVVVCARHLRGGLGCGAAAQLVSVLAREVQQLPPAELLDLLDRRRHDERLLGLLRSATVGVIEDAEGGAPTSARCREGGAALLPLRSRVR